MEKIFTNYIGLEKKLILYFVHEDENSHVYGAGMARAFLQSKFLTIFIILSISKKCPCKIYWYTFSNIYSTRSLHRNYQRIRPTLSQKILKRSRKMASKLKV